MGAIEDKIHALIAKQGLAKNTTTPSDIGAAKKKKKKAAPEAKRVATRPNKQAERAELFAHAYVRSGCNATAAYKEISPNCKDTTAQVEGSKYLCKPMIQHIIEPLLAALMEKNEIDTEWAIGRLVEQSNASPLDYFRITEDGGLGGFDLTEITPAQRRNLKSIKYTKTSMVQEEGDNEVINETWTVTMVDQQKAVELLGRYLQIFTKEAESEDVERIGDLITAGVKRIRANKALMEWKDGAFEGTFSEVG